MEQNILCSKTIHKYTAAIFFQKFLLEKLKNKDNVDNIYTIKIIIKKTFEKDYK